MLFIFNFHTFFKKFELLLDEITNSNQFVSVIIDDFTARSKS